MAEINKIHIGNERISSRQSKQLMLEMNYIMPDNKPRINSIVQTSVRPVISATSLVGDTVNFNISADCMLLYNALSVSEEEEHLYTTSCEFSKTFKETIIFDSEDEESSIAENKSYLVGVHTDNVETVLISDRKAVVKAYITVSAISKQTVGCDVIESFDDKSIVCKKAQIDNMRSVGVMRVQSFVKEDVTLDSALPQVDVILHKDAAVSIDNQRISDSKAIFYGSVHVDTVYSNIESVPHFYSTGFDINFNQACEIPDVSQSAVLNIVPVVAELSVDAKENGILSIEALVSFDVEVYDYFVYDITQDAFLPGMSLELKTENVRGSDTFVLSNNVGVCSEKLSVPNADVEAVLYSSVKQKECNSYIEGKNIYFEGIYSIESVYVPKSDGNVLRVASAEVPYSYMFEARATNGNVIDCSVNIKSVTSQLNDYGEIVLKWVAAANASVMEESTYSVITSAQAKPIEAPEEKALYYHFIGENEKIWDIAKHFGVSPENLCKMNGIENADDISGLKGVVVIKR